MIAFWRSVFRLACEMNGCVMVVPGMLLTVAIALR